MNASDILKYGHSFVTRNLVDLPMDKWEIDGACGWWGVKEIIAHLASFEHLLVDILRSFVDGGPTPTRDLYLSKGGQYFNDYSVEIRQGKTPAEQLDELVQAYEETMRLIGRIAPETLRQPGTLPWYGPEYALDDFIVYQYYGHKREHMAQVNVFKDSLRPEPPRRPQAKVAG
jgi:hypothetical protein